MDRFPHTPIPQLGLARSDVLAQLLAMKQGDQDWRGGRVFSLVYSAGDDVHELLSDALALYSAENGLNVLAFPSIGTMQHDIIRNTASLLGADDPASGGAVEGYLTSGGTESDNLALFGTLENAAAPAHFITTSIEHDAVLRAAESLSKKKIEVTILPSTPQGVIEPAALLAAIRPALASISLRNSAASASLRAVLSVPINR